MLTRNYFEHDGLKFSYLERMVRDAEGVLLILHAHWMGASDFEDVIPYFSEAWRVLALDQRGHGETSHGGDHSVAAYKSDIDALLADRGISEPIVILGHSFGGMVANLYTAQNPQRVRALIMEDIDVCREDNDEFMLAWRGHFSSREELETKLGERLAPYLQRSIIQDDRGWRLNFEPEEVLASERALNGDHWPEWLSHNCPAMVIRGEQSIPVSGEALAEMARRRPNTQLVTIQAGHSVHVDAPEAFVLAVNRFLEGLPRDRGQGQEPANT